MLSESLSLARQALSSSACQSRKIHSSNISRVFLENGGGTCHKHFTDKTTIVVDTVHSIDSCLLQNHCLKSISSVFIKSDCPLEKKRALVCLSRQRDSSFSSYQKRHDLFGILMAPVTATNVGMAPQVIDSPELKTLMDTLNAMEMKEGAEMRIMESLVETLEPFSTTAWRFEEQVRFVYSV